MDDSNKFPIDHERALAILDAQSFDGQVEQFFSALGKTCYRATTSMLSKSEAETEPANEPTAPVFPSFWGDPLDGLSEEHKRALEIIHEQSFDGQAERFLSALRQACLSGTKSAVSKLTSGLSAVARSLDASQPLDSAGTQPEAVSYDGKGISADAESQRSHEESSLSSTEATEGLHRRRNAHVSPD